MVYSTGRSKAVVPVLVLLFVALWFILRGDLFYFLPCVILILFFVFFSSFSIAITSLGEERANLSAFRMFVPFVLVWFCWFHFPLDVWEGLRFVIVALPGLFSYHFFYYYTPPPPPPPPENYVCGNIIFSDCQSIRFWFLRCGIYKALLIDISC